MARFRCIPIPSEIAGHFRHSGKDKRGNLIRIFVHAEACRPFVSENELPPIVREHTLVSLRCYDAADQCLMLCQIGRST